MELLKTGEDTTLAQRVLERYTGQQLVTAADWQEWLNAKRDKLKFDESSGMFVD
jgi:hypothetical protein